MKASPIRCLVTAGPTREFFDPVRFLSNPSSGKMGYALAEAGLERGWQVHLVSGPVSLPVPEGMGMTRVVTGEEMYRAVHGHFQHCDVLIMTAAIMDYRPREKASTKIKKDQLDMYIEMEPVVDVLATVAGEKKHQLIVGFAAETDHLDTYARQKLEQKNADYIIANYIGGEEGAFERDTNTVFIYSRNAPPVPMGPLPKRRIARDLLAVIEPAVLARLPHKP